MNIIIARARSANRPYSAYQQDDKASYMSHHQLKKREEKNRKTIDGGNYIRAKNKKRRTKAKNEDEEEWERFNEQLSYKSGASRRSNKSQQSKFSQRLRSAVGNSRHRYNKEEPKNVYQQQKNVLTHKNLKDFEEILSSQAAASVKNYQLEGQQIQIEPQEPAEELKETGEIEQNEGEGDESKYEQINPNEADNEEVEEQEANEE